MTDDGHPQHVRQALCRVLLLWVCALLVGSAGVVLHLPNAIIPLSALVLAPLILRAPRRR